MVICVYKITCLNPEIHWSYVGSTKNYSKRKSNHKSNCYNKKRPQYNKKAYCFIRANKGFDNFKFEIIEEFNKNNKEIISQKYKEYYEKNKEILLQKQNEYYENNKEIINLKHKVKINCNFCNRLVRKDSMKRHQRTKFCLNIQSNLKK